MIPVTPQPEPNNFDATVRRPGILFLQENQNPSSKQFDSHSYWIRSTSDMCTAYENICAYSGCRIHTDATIDHFSPKSKHPMLAYEWSNYRLCMNKLNQRKSQDEKVLDPFKIQSGWFKIDFPSCLVVASDSLEAEIKTSVEYTIAKLKLNDNSMVEFRYEIVNQYVTNSCTLEFLLRVYPFVASEIRRQEILIPLRDLFFGRGNPEA